MQRLPPAVQLASRIPRVSLGLVFSFKGFRRAAAECRRQDRPFSSGIDAATRWYFRWCSLPGTARIVEVHLDIRGYSESCVLGQLRAAVPGEGLHQVHRQPPRLLNERIHHGLGVLAT